MSALITDEVLAAFAVVGPPEEIGPLVTQRYGGLVQRVAFTTPYDLDHEVLARAVASFD
jgi:hypothetical protein